MRDRLAPDGDAVAFQVRYRCCGCGFEFVPSEPGTAACPRCQSVGGHDRIGVREASHGRVDVSESDGDRRGG